MQRPRKRQRVLAAADEDDEDEFNFEPEELNARRDPELRLRKSRADATLKLKSAWEGIFERYGRDFSDIGDEIELSTGKIVVNNGHLASLPGDGVGAFARHGHGPEDLDPEHAAAPDRRAPAIASYPAAATASSFSSPLADRSVNRPPSHGPAFSAGGPSSVSRPPSSRPPNISPALGPPGTSSVDPAWDVPNLPGATGGNSPSFSRINTAVQAWDAPELPASAFDNSFHLLGRTTTIRKIAQLMHRMDRDDGDDEDDILGLSSTRHTSVSEALPNLPALLEATERSTQMPQLVAGPMTENELRGREQTHTEKAGARSLAEPRVEAESQPKRGSEPNHKIKNLARPQQKKRLGRLGVAKAKAALEPTSTQQASPNPSGELPSGDLPSASSVSGKVPSKPRDQVFHLEVQLVARKAVDLAAFRVITPEKTPDPHATDSPGCIAEAERSSSKATEGSTEAQHVPKIVSPVSEARGRVAAPAERFTINEMDPAYFFSDEDMPAIPRHTARARNRYGYRSSTHILTREKAQEPFSSKALANVEAVILDHQEVALEDAVQEQASPIPRHDASCCDENGEDHEGIEMDPVPLDLQVTGSTPQGIRAHDAVPIPAFRPAEKIASRSETIRTRRRAAPAREISASLSPSFDASNLGELSEAETPIASSPYNALEAASARQRGQGGTTVLPRVRSHQPAATGPKRKRRRASMAERTPRSSAVSLAVDQPDSTTHQDETSRSRPTPAVPEVIIISSSPQGPSPQLPLGPPAPINVSEEDEETFTQDCSEIMVEEGGISHRKYKDAASHVAPSPALTSKTASPSVLPVHPHQLKPSAAQTPTTSHMKLPRNKYALRSSSASTSTGPAPKSITAVAATPAAKSARLPSSAKTGLLSLVSSSDDDDDDLDELSLDASDFAMWSSAGLGRGSSTRVPRFISHRGHFSAGPAASASSRCFRRNRLHPSVLASSPGPGRGPPSSSVRKPRLSSLLSPSSSVPKIRTALSRRLLFRGWGAPGGVAQSPRTPSKPRTGSAALSSPAGLASPSRSVGSTVQTAGGTRRTCGVDGYRCDRDFCFVCL